MQTVVVTGAGRGIGAAVARAFAEESDARIALIARTGSELEAVAESCRAAGAEAMPVPCDVTDETEVKRAAEAIRAAYGAADILVNNAGAFAPGGVLETGVTTFRAQLEVNLTSAFIVTRAFLPDMLHAGRGTVVFMASVASIKGYARGVSYGAAKHGLLGLARSLREEMREEKIRVAAVLPGATYTDSWAASEMPESRFMPPEDVARSIVAITRLSDRSVVEEFILRPQLGDV